MKNHLILFVLLAVSVNAMLNGISIKEKIADFSCFPKTGYFFAFIRGYKNDGTVDPNARANVIAAAKAGMYINVYMNPANIGKTKPEAQVQNMVKALNGTDYLTIVVMVKDKWSKTEADNCQ